MKQEKYLSLRTKHIRWTRLLSLAKHKPWLASYLFRQLQRLRDKMPQYVQSLCFTLSLTRPRQMKKLIKRTAAPLLAGGGLMLVLNIGLVQAASITVTQTADIIGNGDGCSLREAIINANNDNQSGSTDCAAGSGTDTITLPDGTIILTLTGSDEDNSLTGDLDVTSGSRIILQGQGQSQSIIDGNSSDRVFHLLTGANLTLSDLTVQGGRVLTGSGGGIFNYNADLTLTNSIVTGNLVESGSGGIGTKIVSSSANQNSDLKSKLRQIRQDLRPDTLVSRSVLATTPLQGYGGGILNQAITGTARLTVTNSIISNNQAGSVGGGIGSYANNGTAHTLLTNSTTSYNSALYGGGMATQSRTGGIIDLTITASTFNNNNANYVGGGIATQNRGESTSVIISGGSTITNNQAGFVGAGLHHETSAGNSTIEVVESTISGNSNLCCGGGINHEARYDGASTLNITNSTISNNSSMFFGGGLANYSYDYGIATANVSGSTINENGAIYGAGIGTSGYYYGNAHLNITNSTIISGNTATGGQGGGVYTAAYNQSTSILTSTNSTISNNSAELGGGIVMLGADTELIKSTLIDSVVSGNTVTGAGGGLGTFAYEGATIEFAMTNSVVQDNTASANGGGLFIFGNASDTVSGNIDRSTVSGNTSGTNGGGIDNYSRSSGEISLTVSNSTISGNQADRNSGGVGSYSESDGKNLIEIINSTITNNTADNDNDGDGDGGGIYAKDPLTVTNSIVAGNFDTPSNAGGGTIHPDGHNNVIGDANNLVSNITGISGSLGSGSDIVDSDLGLEALANNGGTVTASGVPPFTHAVLQTSPAFNAGDNTICAVAPINATDQRGETRPGTGGDTCEIGAYEYQVPFIFMPAVYKDFAILSDLVVDSIVVTSTGVTVTIRNAGDGTITNDFWVDVYFNPTETPTLNKEWHEIAEAGLVWGVTASLAPGESLILTIGNSYYSTEDSSTTYPSGATVYALVDSIDAETSYGNVLEADEGNNLGGPITSTGSSATSIKANSSAPSNALPKR